MVISPTNVGTISAAGLYTAPGLPYSSQTVAVTATSQADNSKTAAAAITLNQPVTISLTPTTNDSPPGKLNSLRQRLLALQIRQ